MNPYQNTYNSLLRYIWRDTHVSKMVVDSEFIYITIFAKHFIK